MVIYPVITWTQKIAPLKDAVYYQRVCLFQRYFTQVEMLLRTVMDMINDAVDKLNIV